MGPWTTFGIKLQMLSLKVTDYTLFYICHSTLYWRSLCPDIGAILPCLSLSLDSKFPTTTTIIIYGVFGLCQALLQRLHMYYYLIQFFIL